MVLSRWRTAVSVAQTFRTLRTAQRPLNTEAFLGRSVLEGLKRDGYAIADGLGEVLCDSLRQEIVELHEHGLLLRNSSVLLSPDGSLLPLEKSEIYEMEAGLSDIAELIPAVTRMQVEQGAVWRDKLNAALGLHLTSQAVKVQCNTKGAFPLHHDSDERDGSGRRVTGVLYLNPSWKPEDGGQLRLYPLPFRHVDIPPLSGRMALFSSRGMLHRVLPSTAPLRVCMTLWFATERHAPSNPDPAAAADRASTGNASNGSGNVGAMASATREEAQAQAEAEAGAEAEAVGAALAACGFPASAWSSLRRLVGRQGVWKHASRLVYAQEWAESIEQSHLPGQARDEAIERHWRDVERTLRVLGGSEDWRRVAPFLPIDREVTLTKGQRAALAKALACPWF